MAMFNVPKSNFGQIKNGLGEKSQAVLFVHTAYDKLFFDQFRVYRLPAAAESLEELYRRGGDAPFVDCILL